LPPEVTARDVETPFTVQPFEEVMASRKVFDVRGAERVVVEEQLSKRPEATPVAEVR
jgi:hypothetical protein